MQHFFEHELLVKIPKWRSVLISTFTGCCVIDILHLNWALWVCTVLYLIACCLIQSVVILFFILLAIWHGWITQYIKTRRYGHYTIYKYWGAITYVHSYVITFIVSWNICGFEKVDCGLHQGEGRWLWNHFIHLLVIIFILYPVFLLFKWILLLLAWFHTERTMLLFEQIPSILWFCLL